MNNECFGKNSARTQHTEGRDAREIVTHRETVDDKTLFVSLVNQYRTNIAMIRNALQKAVVR